ncbi:MAG: hypothetical protein AB7P02_10010 [Alphaproteobacteria bacterium]
MRHAIAFLLTLLLVHAASAQQPAAVDGRVIGTWTLQTITPQGAPLVYRWEIRPDGLYTFRAEGAGAPPAHSGRAAFVDGKWSLQAATGQAGWTDSGIYQVLSPDMVFFAGRLGPGTWQRAGGAPAAAAPAAWPRTLAEIARRASALARTHRADAFLYELNATLAAPTLAPRPAGTEHELDLRFYSPSEQFVLSVTPGNAAGEVWPGGRYDLTGRRPLPDRFLDLSEAERRAGLLGMRGRSEKASLTWDGTWPWPHWKLWPVSASQTWDINASAGGMPAPRMTPDQLGELVRDAAAHLPRLVAGLGRPGRMTTTPDAATARREGLVEQLILRVDGIGKGGVIAVAVHRDRAAGERSIADLTTHGGQYAQRGVRRWDDAGVGALELPCLVAFTPGRHLAARCAWMHPTLPLVVSGEVALDPPATLDQPHMDAMVDQGAFPLAMAAVFFAADLLPR